MGMENSVEDRLWDKDVQEFIEACKHCQLSDVLLDYTVMDGGRKILNVTASFRSRTRGSVMVGYRWAESPRYSWLPQVFVGGHTAPAAHRPGAFRQIAWRAGLWRERTGLDAALLAVKEVFFRAQIVRGGLDKEHLKLHPDVEAAQKLTLQVINDLAFLYSCR